MVVSPVEPTIRRSTAAVQHRRIFEVESDADRQVRAYATFFRATSGGLRDRCGLSHEDFFRAGIQPPIVRYEVEYLQPSRLDEQLTVVARLHGTDAARLNTSYQVFGPEGALRVAARTVQVFTDIHTGIPCFVPPKIWLDCLERWRKGEFACLQA
jgi:acyl-CoA thioesterase FadM